MILRYRAIWLLIFSAFLSGCASGPAKFLPEIEYNFSGKLDNHLQIYSYSGKSYRAPQSTMAYAGGTFITIATEDSGKAAPHQIFYSRNLERVFVDERLFSSVKYVEDSEHDVNKFLSSKRDLGVQPKTKKNSARIDVMFKKIYEGSDGWPLEIEAQILLSNDGTILLNKEYKVKAHLFNTEFNCMDCTGMYVAYEMLNSQILPDINRALGGEAFSKRERVVENNEKN